MDRQTDRQTDRKMDIQTEGWTDRQTDRKMDIQTGGWTDRQTVGSQTDRKIYQLIAMYRQTDRRTD